MFQFQFYKIKEKVILTTFVHSSLLHSVIDKAIVVFVLLMVTFFYYSESKLQGFKKRRRNKEKERVGGCSGKLALK